MIGILKRSIATRMGLKPTGSIDKKIDNLNIYSENRMMLGLSGQWSRVEQRDSLDNLSIMELFNVVRSVAAGLARM